MFVVIDLTLPYFNLIDIDPVDGIFLKLIYFLLIMCPLQAELCLSSVLTHYPVTLTLFIFNVFIIM